jgi:hypothetical protein
MKFKEMIARWTGFSVPIFGVSWNPPESDSAVAQRVIAFLEDRRVLYNPYCLEVDVHCIYSVIDIRRFLTSQIGGLSADSTLGEHLRAIRAACRRFLDKEGPKRVESGEPFHPGRLTFFTSLGALRASIGIHVAAIAVMYGLDVEGQLADALPDVDEPSLDDW